MVEIHLFEALTSVLAALLVGAISTAITRIWAAQNRFQKQSEELSNRLTRLETLANGLPRRSEP